MSLPTLSRRVSHVTCGNAASFRMPISSSDTRLSVRKCPAMYDSPKPMSPRRANSPKNASSSIHIVACWAAPGVPPWCTAPSGR